MIGEEQSQQEGDEEDGEGQSPKGLVEQARSI